ncbi:hypothetical protein, variant [Verruconis gallopava]|uniref:U2 small nuclear ribonucleoprotein A' n=1 Tax=Verruconis gallopava TaxID=253628 RepID=A0A0D2AMU1_9PEZI|nr:uncharacterized protein PV09_07967 [Verruconis gallopava]XP_016210308.1 hypothetical protein, variant [Verruconis gallopava]KIW00438.1 hypothetical protein PV09_07967 [Verruconis gallopava]KIW00439.1 hypothetical protein, variant [Verruconis gallopava]
MRLTAELIQNSLSYINPLGERELDLRGHKIPAIENMGVASRDQDCIDFTDNDISVLGNFPLSPRLQTLLLTRNRISSIQPTLYRSIPNLKSLVLTQNRIVELADLEPLSRLEKLTYLILNDNPVKTKENYRLWVIWRCPKVRFLDYQKVRDAERQKANELFGSMEEPTALAAKILSIKSKATFDVAPTANGSSSSREIRVKLTPKERKRVEEMIKNAKSIREMEELERMLSEGKIPGGVLDDEMET